MGGTAAVGSKCREGGLVVCNANKCGRSVCWRWQQLLFTKYWQQQLQQQEQIAVVIAMAAEVYLAAMVSFGKISVRRRLGSLYHYGWAADRFFFPYRQIHALLRAACGEDSRSPPDVW